MSAILYEKSPKRAKIESNKGQQAAPASAAINDEKKRHLNDLLEELLKKSPSKAKVHFAAEKLSLKFDGDLEALMTRVLAQWGSLVKTQTTKNSVAKDIGHE